MCHRLVFRLCPVVSARAASGPAGHPRGVLCPSGVRPGLLRAVVRPPRRQLPVRFDSTACSHTSGREHWDAIFYLFQRANMSRSTSRMALIHFGVWTIDTSQYWLPEAGASLEGVTVGGDRSRF